MANKAWLDNPHSSTHRQATSNGKPSGSSNPSAAPMAGWGKQAFVNGHTTIRGQDEVVTTRSLKDAPSHAASTSASKQREPPPHLRNAASPTAEKPSTNGWSKLGTSVPVPNGTAVNGRMTGFKPIPTGPRKDATQPRKPSVDLSSRTTRRDLNGTPTGTANGSHPVRKHDSGIHIPLGNGHAVAVHHPPPVRNGMSVFDDFDARVTNASTRRTSTNGAVPPPPAMSPPPPPQDDEVPPPPASPPSMVITPEQTARLLKSPEERSKIAFGLGSAHRDEGSRKRPMKDGDSPSKGSLPFEPEQTTESSAKTSDLYPWIPPSPNTIYANPPDFTRHISDRGNYKTCDPALHHLAKGKEEPMNTGCGRAFKHEKPITRYDGSWQGKEVDVLEVRDPRGEMDPALREKGMGSKKDAYKGLYQIDAYEWDENSPFVKPPPAPEGICISNLNPLITLSQIDAVVSTIGKTKNIDMKLDPRTGMQMGICHITFNPGEERQQVKDEKKKTTVFKMVEIPAWRIAKNAKERLNGKVIGVNLGSQKESIMKVVLDGNGDKARKAVEMALDKRRRDSISKSTPVASTPIQHMPSATSWMSHTLGPGATTSTIPMTSATPMPPPPMIPSSRPPASRNPEPSPKAPLATLASRPPAYDARATPRNDDRMNGSGFGYTSGQSNANGRPYNNALVNNRSSEIGRLPPPSSSSYASIRMSSSYVPTSNTLSSFSSVSSFVAAPFAKSRGREPRMPPARDGWRGSAAHNEPPKPMDRQQPPSALEDYHRRSSRSRRSSSATRTESEASGSEDSSGGRTPSPGRRRTRRSPELPRRTPRKGDRANEHRDETNEAEQLVEKVREELRENGKAYIFIDYKSLPVPSKTSDRERAREDLKDHLIAVKVDKVTYNLHGWYVLFADDQSAKKAHVVYDNKPMNGRRLALSVKEPLARPVEKTSATLSASPALVKRTPQSEPGSAKKLEAHSIPHDVPETEAEDAESEAKPLLAKTSHTPVRRPKATKQKATRVISSDDEEVAQVDEKTVPAESSNSVDPAEKDVDVAQAAVEEIVVNGKEDSATVTSMDLIDPDAETQVVEVKQPARSHKKKAPAAKNKRKSDAVGKSAKQPAKKKQKKAAASVVVEEAEPNLMEVDVLEPEQADAQSTPASADLKPTVAVNAVAEVSISDLIQSGIATDDEDLFYLRLAAEHSLKGTVPDLPVDTEEAEEEVTSEIHPSGCARAHGYYKVPELEKSAYLPQRNRAVAEVEAAATNAAAIATSRSTRVNSRRLVQGMELHKKGNANATDTDLFQFNQLRTRKKQLKFSKSPIHDWGLYAMEHITQGEMVIEYVGEVIRAQVADIREKWYEKTGIGSSYLFRVDDDAVVDATKKGNLGRLINHCCYPNCTAKIITINGEKKIVIYAKSNIEPGEEITYDYHFPIEQEKIPCLCGSDKCRGYLN